ncbi:predicted protein [Postia placenta Mad-698-R]|nr:predicted protein [Postia placenta Mad-698-R]
MVRAYTTEQTVASSPPQEGLPSILEAAPGYYQKHPPTHPEDVFTTLRINFEPAQTTENLQSPVNEQPFKLPDIQYVPIEAPDTEPPPASSAPTNALVEPPMTTFTQADINQRIAAALDTHRLQQSTANRPLRLDIPTPEPFSGKAEDLRCFLQCVLFYFVATNNTRLNDEAKIAFTIALMRKDLGKTWADAYYMKLAEGVQVYPDWAAFATALEEAFPEHGTRIKAHQILMKLPERQKNKKTVLSLGNYITCFEQLASKAQLKDTEVNGINRTENDYHTLHANFIKGLPKELYVSLTTRVARDRPNTMKAWYDEVRNANAAEQGALTVTDTRDYGKPMDINTAAVAATFASTWGGRKWELGAVLNEADRKLHRDGNLCFYCHIKSHSTKDCHKKAAARQGGGRPNQGGSRKDNFHARIKALSADEKRELRYIPTRTNMSSTLSFLDQFNAPLTKGGKRLSIYTPKHTHVGDSTLLTLLLSNPTDVFNMLKAHNPKATNATDRAALEAYLSARREYDEAVKAADKAIDHYKRLLCQQDNCVLTKLIRLDNLKVAYRFQPLLPCNIRAQHNKFIPRAIPNAYLPLPTPLPTSAFRQPPIPSPFLQATPRSTTIPADWQPNPGWTPKGSCRQCGSSRHWVWDCLDVRCAGCRKEAPGHLEQECETRPMKRHISAPPEEPAQRVRVAVDNVFLEGIINEVKERKEKERQTKAVLIPPPCSTNPQPPTRPVAGPLRPRPDTPVVFRKVDPDWTPNTTQWTWDSSWPNQKHLSGEEWTNVGRNACKEWFDEEEDDGVDWELYGDGKQLCTLVRAQLVCAQHADAATGAVDSDTSISGR